MGSKNPDTPCAINGCARPMDSRGWCTTHYERWRIHGDVNAGARVSDRERFAKAWVEDEAGCQIFQGKINNRGYGEFTVKGRSVLAHRYSYELQVGPIPEGLEIDHLCRVTTCCNHEHLEVVTHAENVRRRDMANGTGSAKTHCPQGHPYDEENTSHRNGRRHCKACARARAKRNYDRKKSSCNS